ncbi:3-hydroxyacyl-CoA dehydrogenase family protein [Hazenella coriacea]|uniref:3-hydroxybutyryl-CoA dehydrogenase n=1 Tax=Hazenella coriacea TaxID=1179467 RepID=A0A4R3LER9_9BACL|nr:3-hydroxyacyl-CoA dehydrogenase family protein [Hazenella coriacea]TCS96844.1 3-hydroxybutyryl-CoA dehydrogenase [Hazenella coriacea]
MTVKVILIGDEALDSEVAVYLQDKEIEVIPLAEPIPDDVDVVIDLELGMDEQKRFYLLQVEKVVSKKVPIFTSTLHRTATEVASWVQYPERIIGFSPLLLHEMDVIEVSRPLQVEENEDWYHFLSCWESWGKRVEIVNDLPGLVFPRILSLLVNEGTFALNEGVATVADIDLAMKKGTNFPYGPLEWADRVGVGQVVAVLTGLQRELGEERYRPAPLLRKMIYANHLGRRMGRGFYRYEGGLMK